MTGMHSDLECRFELCGSCVDAIGVWRIAVNE